MLKQKSHHKTVKPAANSLGKPRQKKLRPQSHGGYDNVSDYIGAMAAELAQLANANRLDALAVACDVVREIAAGNVKSQSRQNSRPDNRLKIQQEMRREMGTVGRPS